MKTSANILKIGAAVLLLSSCTKEVVSPGGADMAAVVNAQRPAQAVSFSGTNGAAHVRPISLPTPGAQRPAKPVVFVGPGVIEHSDPTTFDAIRPLNLGSGGSNTSDAIRPLNLGSSAASTFDAIRPLNLGSGAANTFDAIRPLDLDNKGSGSALLLNHPAKPIAPVTDLIKGTIDPVGPLTWETSAEAQ